MAKVPCVLIIDDSIDVLQTLSDILGVAGYAVRTAPSAERALQILEGAAVDLVITDLRMGGMGGMALIRRLRESWPDLPVVALSGFADAETVAQAFREGAVDFIAKPFTASEVLETVARALAHRSAGPSSAPVPHALVASQGLTPDQREQAEEILRTLQGRLGAELTLLTGSQGEVLAAQGWVSESVAQAVARAIAQIGALLETLALALGEPAFAAQMWEGAQRALYGLRLEPGRFLVAVVPRTVKPGLAWLELRDAIARLRRLEAAPSLAEAVPPEQPSPAESPPEAIPFLEEGEAFPVPLEGELLSYDEARARGLIPDLEEEEGEGRAG